MPITILSVMTKLHIVDDIYLVIDSRRKSRLLVDIKEEGPTVKSVCDTDIEDLFLNGRLETPQEMLEFVKVISSSEKVLQQVLTSRELVDKMFAGLLFRQDFIHPPKEYAEKGCTTLKEMLGCDDLNSSPVPNDKRTYRHVGGYTLITDETGKWIRVVSRGFSGKETVLLKPLLGDKNISMVSNSIKVFKDLFNLFHVTDACIFTDMIQDDIFLSEYINGQLGCVVPSAETVDLYNQQGSSFELFSKKNLSHNTYVLDDFHRTYISSSNIGELLSVYDAFVQFLTENWCMGLGALIKHFASVGGESFIGTSVQGTLATADQPDTYTTNSDIRTSHVLTDKETIPYTCSPAKVTNAIDDNDTPISVLNSFLGYVFTHISPEHRVIKLSSSIETNALADAFSMVATSGAMIKDMLGGDSFFSFLSIETVRCELLPEIKYAEDTIFGDAQKDTNEFSFVASPSLGIVVYIKGTVCYAIDNTNTESSNLLQDNYVLYSFLRKLNILCTPEDFYTVEYK